MADGYWIWKTKRYKRHFICFHCRKNFKQPNEKDMADQQGELSLLLNAFYYSKPKKIVPSNVIDYLKAQYFKNKLHCPACRAEMAEVSMSFETPPKKNVREWENLQSFYRAEGFVVNDLPLDKKSLVKKLEDALAWHIKMVQDAEDHKSYGESLPNAKNRLRSEVKKLEAELERLKNEKW